VCDICETNIDFHDISQLHVISLTVYRILQFFRIFNCLLTFLCNQMILLREDI